MARRCAAGELIPARGSRSARDNTGPQRHAVKAAFPAHALPVQPRAPEQFRFDAIKPTVFGASELSRMSCRGLTAASMLRLVAARPTCPGPRGQAAG